MTTIYADAHTLVARMLRRTVRDSAGCWVFTGAVTSRGYSCVGSGRKSKSILGHRLMVIARDGLIPPDMTIDHLCRNRRCVNPSHLEVVTLRENVQRTPRVQSSLCKRGHELVPRKDGKGRKCPTCQRDYMRRLWQDARAHREGCPAA